MSKTPERLAYEAWYRKQFDSTMYCESTWRGWEAGRAALTQAADAGATEPVANVEALQSRITALEAELDDMEAERDEALRGPWPEWAERMKTTIRKYSGYDGFDDASDGIDLPAELDDLIEHAVEPSAQQLQKAVARARKDEQEIMHGLLRPVVVEAIRGMRGAPDIEENGKSLVSEIEEVFRAAIRQQGTP